jgi:hypothetical protein
MLTLAPKYGITDQMWSYVILLTGCAMIIICHHLGLTDAVGAGIVGAGIQAFTAQQNTTAPTAVPQGS